MTDQGPDAAALAERRASAKLLGLGVVILVLALAVAVVLVPRPDGYQCVRVHVTGPLVCGTRAYP